MRCCSFQFSAAPCQRQSSIHSSSARKGLPAGHGAALLLPQAAQLPSLNLQTFFSLFALLERHADTVQGLPAGPEVHQPSLQLRNSMGSEALSFAAKPHECPRCAVQGCEPPGEYCPTSNLRLQSYRPQWAICRTPQGDQCFFQKPQ